MSKFPDGERLWSLWMENMGLLSPKLSVMITSILHFVFLVEALSKNVHGTYFGGIQRSSEERS